MKSGVILNDILDHFPCLTRITIPVKSNSNKPKLIRSRELDKSKIEKITSKLLLTDYNQLHNINVNEGYTFVLDKLNQSLDQFAPYKERLIQPNNIIRDPWMSKSLLKSSKKCSLLCRKSIGLPKDNPAVIRYKRHKECLQQT